MTKPSREVVRNILRSELQKIASKGYVELSVETKGEIRQYEIQNEYGTYQIRVEFDRDTERESISLLGAIDGPGVFHFLGFVSSITDVVQVGKESS